MAYLFTRNTKGIEMEHKPIKSNDESGRIGYLILYLLGAPIGLLVLLWVVLGDNIFSAG